MVQQELNGFGGKLGEMLIRRGYTMVGHLREYATPHALVRAFGVSANTARSKLESNGFLNYSWRIRLAMRALHMHFSDL